jgi:orotidine-5'-phosphate decarboxylase
MALDEASVGCRSDTIRGLHARPDAARGPVGNLVCLPRGVGTVALSALYEGAVIVPLDCSVDEVAPAVKEFTGVIRCFKVGLPLIAAGAAAAAAEMIAATGALVMYDGKFHDIPSVVRRAVEQLSSARVDLVTVHCAGGRPMLDAAVEAAARQPDPLLLVGVTVLSSLSASDWHRITGGSGSRQSAVLRLVEDACASGLHAFVCAPDSVEVVRAVAGPDALIITPGIRLDQEGRDDHAAVVTPEGAVRRGANAFIAGRPVLHPPPGVTRRDAAILLQERAQAAFDTQANARTGGS